MPVDPERLNKLSMELRRGALILAVLIALQQAQYGYSLRKQLNQMGLDIDEGTLYPLLRRLEDQGLLDSEWQVQEGRKRRFYTTSTDGVEALGQMQTYWQTLNLTIVKLLEQAP